MADPAEPATKPEHPASNAGNVVSSSQWEGSLRSGFGFWRDTPWVNDDPL